MITWLQNATGKHHRIIFGFLLVVIVVSFMDVNNVYIENVGEGPLICKRVCKSFLHFLAKGGNPPLT